MDEEKTRREFFGQACRGMSLVTLAAALSSVLESCGGGTASPTGATGGASVSALPQLSATASGSALVVSTGSVLASVGSAAFIQGPNGAVLLVARTSESAFTALSAVCTHQACVITARAGENYYCGCHGSVFDASGRPLVGPAVVALRQYTTQFDAATNTLTITA